MGSPGEYYYGKPWGILLREALGEYYYGKPWGNIIIGRLGEYYYGKPWRISRQPFKHLI
jgi:hypothetical protein